MLRQLPPLPHNERLLVDSGTFDDAGVYKINAEQALVQTVDFFTPIVDDPIRFGRIAAANALSDVYAMGGQPLTALNIVGFPQDDLPLDVLADILRGGQEKLSEASVALLGGHTVTDPEPKYGLAVTGMVHPDAIWQNNGARPGDALYITKPLGIGVITTALKQASLPSNMVADALTTMETLNDKAAQAARRVDIHACTDVTGFGLFGHVYEMASASDVDIQLHSHRVPVIEGTLDLVHEGYVCGGSRANLQHIRPHLAVDAAVEEAFLIVFADAITSGGLLLAVPEHHRTALEAAFAQYDVPGAYIGDVLERQERAPRIIVTP